jgi:hypothetical protein
MATIEPKQKTMGAIKFSPTNAGTHAIFERRMAAVLLGLIFMIPLAAFGQGQVTITLLNPNPIPFKPQSLLYLNIISNYNVDKRVHIAAEISDANQSRLISFITEDFDLRPGSNTITALAIHDIKYMNDQVKTWVARDGNLPPANYNYCINIIPFEQAAIGRLCGEVGFVIAPPELIHPYNTEHIPTQFPQLTWHAPTPLTAIMTSALTYSLKLVEIVGNQPEYAAISDNPAIYFGQDIKQEYLAYQPQNHELEKGKTYAWQVSAFSGNYLIGKSEIWTFVIDTAVHEKPIEENGAYTILKASYDGSYIAFTNTVRFKFDGSYSAKTYPLKIYDEGHNDIAPPDLKIVPHYGDNRYSIDLTPYSQFKNNGLYTLELKTDRGEKLTMGFRYIIDKKKHEKRKTSSFIQQDH